MGSGSLALLYFLLGFHGGRQGSGPDRGQSPVEWGDFPSVCPSVRSPLWAIQPGWLGLRPGWMAQRGGDRRTDGRTDGKSPHSTGLCPLSGPLPCYSPTLTQKLYKAGQGYRCPYDASWRLVKSQIWMWEQNQGHLHIFWPLNGLKHPKIP